MVTFGDLKFYTSRAFLDEDDGEDDFECDVAHVTLHLVRPRPEGVATVLVSFGDLANAYLRECVLNSTYTPLGTVRAVYAPSGDSVVATDVDVPRDSVLLGHLQDSGRGGLVCLCHDTRDASVANEVARQLLSLYSTPAAPAAATVPRTLILTSQHISRLRAATAAADDGTGALEAPAVLRCLTTPSCWGDKEGEEEMTRVPRLPQPAIVESVPAAVLTACALQRLPCLLYVAYTETISSTDVSYVKEVFSSAIARHGDFAAAFLINSSVSTEVKEKSAGRALEMRGKVGVDVPENYI